MPLVHDLFEPIDVFLFERLADREKVNASALRFDAPGRLDGILLRRVVEITLLIIPMSRLPSRKIAAHFQVERNSHDRLTRLIRAQRLAEHKTRSQTQRPSQEFSASDHLLAPRVPVSPRPRVPVSPCPR